jgi:NitT/TauT family transport system ATP-binding protein
MTQNVMHDLSILVGVQPAAATAPPAIALTGVSKSYGAYRAVGPLDLTIAKGEFVSLVGPSGCGKSTLLNMIAGFLPTTTGTLQIEGRRYDGPAPFVGYMFQKDTVLPWYTVRRNIGLGPRFRGENRAEITRRVDQLLTLGRLEKFANSYPHQLSGGMRRRLALLMSLACNPRILLLDEPFGALDTHTRTSLHAELVRIRAELGQTVVLVTHDLEEAVTLSDRVVVLAAAPSHILLDERIGLPHPRDVYSVREDEAFGVHHRAIWQVLGRQFRMAESL